jgi:hypothetical protein
MTGQGAVYTCDFDDSVSIYNYLKHHKSTDDFLSMSMSYSLNQMINHTSALNIKYYLLSTHFYLFLQVFLAGNFIIVFCVFCFILFSSLFISCILFATFFLKSLRQTCEVSDDERLFTKSH